MGSRQRFVLSYALVAMVPFTVLTFLNTTDIGVYISGYTIAYFGLRLTMNPKLRLRVDVLGLMLLAFLIYFVALRVSSIVGVPLL
jgi:hypothetical protein